MSGHDKCGFSVEGGRRICDEPATHIYNGIGGRQPACEKHAEFLRKKFGIRAIPIEQERR